MSVEVGFGTEAGGLDVFGFEGGFVRPDAAAVPECTAVKFHRTDGDVHHDAIGGFPRGGRLDVHEFLRTHVRTEPCLGHHQVGRSQRHPVCDDARVAVSDVGKRTAVDERRVALEGLRDVGEEGLTQQQGHGACATDVFGFDGMAVG